MSTTNKISIFFLLIILIGFSYAATAQEYKIIGNEIVKIDKPEAETIQTNLTHTVKGVKYPVYQSAKGKYYILRTSKKSGKQYKQYFKTEI